MKSIKRWIKTINNIKYVRFDEIRYDGRIWFATAGIYNKDNKLLTYVYSKAKQLKYAFIFLKRKTLQTIPTYAFLSDKKILWWTSARYRKIHKKEFTGKGIYYGKEERKCYDWEAKGKALPRTGLLLKIRK